MSFCKSILVAEDNDDTREMMVRHLRRGGYVVQEARNGSEALRMLGEMPAPVLVLLDLMMPVMDGWEFLNRKKVRGLEQHQIITISAVNPHDDNTHRAFFDEVAGNICKPIHAADLNEVARQFCGPRDPAELRT